jgi:hypothetical protein
MYNPESFGGDTASVNSSAESSEALAEELAESELQDTEVKSQEEAVEGIGAETKKEEERVEDAAVEDGEVQNEDPGAVLAAKEEKLEELYGELGFAIRALQQARGVGISPDAADQQGLIEQIEALEGEKREWAEKYGAENVPEGIAIQDEDGEWSQGSRMEIIERALTPEERRKLIDDWKKDSVEYFSKWFEKSPRTKDALNLKQVLTAIKVNLPSVIERQAKNFLEGKSEELPEFVRVNFKTNSLWDSIMDRPNHIRDFKFTFGKEEVMVKQEEIEVEEESQVKESSEDEGDSKDEAGVQNGNTPSNEGEAGEAGV